MDPPGEHTPSSTHAIVPPPATDLDKIDEGITDRIATLADLPSYRVQFLVCKRIPPDLPLLDLIGGGCAM